MSSEQNTNTQHTNLTNLLLQALISQQSPNNPTQNTPQHPTTNSINTSNEAVVALLSALEKGENTTLTLGGQTISLNLSKNNHNHSVSNTPEIHLLSSSEDQEREEKSEATTAPPRQQYSSLQSQASDPKSATNPQSVSSNKNIVNNSPDNFSSGRLNSERKESSFSEKQNDVLALTFNPGHSNFESEKSASSYTVESEIKAGAPSKKNDLNDLLTSLLLEQNNDFCIDASKIGSLPGIGKNKEGFSFQPVSFDISCIAPTSEIYNGKSLPPIEPIEERKEEVHKKSEHLSSDEEKDLNLSRDIVAVRNEMQELPENITKKFQNLLDRLQKENKRLALKNQKMTKRIDTLKKQQVIKEIFSSPSRKASSISSTIETQLHFAFMFAAPLVLSYEDYSRKKKLSPIYIEVDYRTELETVKRILSKSTDELKFRSFVANQARLGECFNMKPRALHFCGHGVKNNNENFKYMKKGGGEGDFLIMEDEEGKAEFKSCSNLHNLLQDNKLSDTLEFVFVASCHSSLVGEVFRKAGAKHVICVGREEKILDDACLQFTEHFYQSYFTGGNSVCAAFEKAKEFLSQISKFPSGEEQKFILLKPEGYHRCEPIFGQRSIDNRDRVENRFVDLTPVPLFKRIPARIENFLGRHIELYEVVKLIRRQRFVVIKGIPGIGKSSLCKEVANFLFERNMFQDGIIYISATGYESTESVISMLDSKLGFLTKDIKEQTVGGIMVHVTNYLSDKVRDALIVLDNIDEVFQNEKVKFRALIELILVTCPRVKILLTCRYAIGDLQNASQKVFNLSHLDEVNARELFFSKAPRSIDVDEMREFFQNDTSLPTEDMFSSQAAVVGKEKKFLENELGLQKDNLDELTLFSKHHLMQMLGGHPQAISLAAALLVDRTLTEVYHLMISNPIMNVLKVEGLNEDEAKSINSIQVSLDVSLRYLQQKSQDAVEFFGLLGLLPGGVLESDLKTLWGKKWIGCPMILLRYSLVLRHSKPNASGVENTRYTLYPFMVKYAEERLKEEERERLNKKITWFLKEKAETIYNKVDSKVYFDIFQKEEINIKACLKREFEYARRMPESPRKPERSEQEVTNNLFGTTKASLKLLAKFNAGKEEIKKSSLEKAKRPAEEEKNNKGEKDLVVTENMAHELGPARIRSSLTVQRNSFVLTRSERKTQKYESLLGVGKMEKERFTISSPLKMRESDELFFSKKEMGKSGFKSLKSEGDERMSLGSFQEEVRKNTINPEIDMTTSVEITGKQIPRTTSSPEKINIEQENSIKGIDLLKRATSMEYKPPVPIEHKPQVVEYKPPKIIVASEAVAKNVVQNTGRTDIGSMMSYHPVVDHALPLIKPGVFKYLKLSNLHDEVSEDVMGELRKPPSLSEKYWKEKLPEQKLVLDSYISREAILTRPLSLITKDELSSLPCEDCTEEFMQELKKPVNPALKSLLTIEGKAAEKIEKNGKSQQMGQAMVMSQTGREYGKPKNPKRVTMQHPVVSSDTFDSKVLDQAKQRNTMWRDDVIEEENEEGEMTKNARFAWEEEGKSNGMLISCHLALLYCSTLFVLLRFDECEKLVNQSKKLAKETQDKLAEANLIKLNACLYWIKTNFDESLKEFARARDLFYEVGSLLGQAICEAAIGYIQGLFLSEDHATITGIKGLEKALDMYNQLDHIFGVYFVNSWLAFIKSKVPSLKIQSKKHANDARRTLRLPKTKKEMEGHLHKAGFFVLRWMGDHVSIFLEIANISGDSKLVKRKSREEEKSFTSSLNQLASSQALSKERVSKRLTLINRTTIQELEALKAPGGLEILPEVDEHSFREGHSFSSSSSTLTPTKIPLDVEKIRLKNTPTKGVINPIMVMPSLKKRIPARNEGK